jgi:hypothetical protein
MMYFEARCGGSDRKSFSRCLVIATMVLAAACSRAASVGVDQRDPPSQVVKIDDVHFRVVDSELTVQYRTLTSSRECNVQAAEMPKVWDMIVKARLKESPMERVVLFPEDASGQSVAIQFAKSVSGQWSAAAPCSITIPV